MDERQQLLAAVEELCKREGMAPTAYGRKALGDGRFAGGLRNENACYRDVSSAIERTKPAIG